MSVDSPAGATTKVVTAPVFGSIFNTGPPAKAVARISRFDSFMWIR